MINEIAALLIEMSTRQVDQNARCISIYWAVSYNAGPYSIAQIGDYGYILTLPNYRIEIYGQMVSP